MTAIAKYSFAAFMAFLVVSALGPVVHMATHAFDAVNAAWPH
jgi:hypothetical protein